MLRKTAAEGGCGVVGLASALPIKGKHLLPALRQMCNRGNGKGGGIAAAGLDPSQFGVTEQQLREDHLVALAYLDPSCREAVEKELITARFEVEHVHTMPYGDPLAVLYFIKGATDEEIYQNSFTINKSYYAAEGSKRAFVLSHGKNLLILKMVGYADQVIESYHLHDLQAHVWIGHHRYPTKGRVWHPGGAHPFCGMHEALVHNGDFANYFSMSEYLSQRGIYPLFLTDTEAAVLLFDLLQRRYGYPLEYVIEALAPTTERDFELLPDDKKPIYRLLQQMHMRGSPDGPWFFLIAQTQQDAYRLIGITDTSMLRPQVFALQQEVIGLAASEQQAIDAVLVSLAAEDARFRPCADYYWNARGGSHTDGGAFSFTVQGGKLSCRDKFGRDFKPMGAPYKPIMPKDGPSGHVVDAIGFSSEGSQALSCEVVRLVRAGIKHLTVINCRGQRFIGCGLGPRSHGVEIDVYGNAGDYLASGLDGATVRLYGNGQDQLGQIMRSGTLVVYGSVGQTFMYGAKGGSAFIRGNAAGRPLINAVGRPRVIINGTCLDYLAESFMAGDPLNNGGFIVVNGLALNFDDIVDLESPYPGGNLFSLASGGAIYLRDPHGAVVQEQLHGAIFAPMTKEDWQLILPYLELNNHYFHIPLSRLLTVDGATLSFEQVYRKIIPSPGRHLSEEEAEEAWVKGV